MTEFTFGVVTYNSAATIIETLESIKYQIEQYGEEIQCYLIVSDDCSKDETETLVKMWIEKNRNLFKKTQVLKTNGNSGLCINYALLINNIKTNYFIQIAGDDLISSKNIFETLSDMKKDEIRVYMPILYDGNHVSITNENIGRQLFYRKIKHTNSKDIHILETLSPYCTVEITFLKEYYTVDSMEFIKQYRNFEDDTSLYYILKNNKNVTFSFRMEPFLLYRRSGTELTTSTNNASQILFLDDLYRFRRLTLKNEKNIPTKIFLVLSVWHHFLIKHRFDASNTMYKKIKHKIEVHRVNKGMKDLEYKIYQDKLNEFVKNEDSYLKTIKKISEIFLTGV